MNLLSISEKAVKQRSRESHEMSAAFLLKNMERKQVSS